MVYQVEVKEIQYLEEIRNDLNRETARATGSSHRLLSMYLVLRENSEVGMCLYKENRSGVREIDFYGQSQDMWHVINIVREMIAENKINHPIH